MKNYWLRKKVAKDEFLKCICKVTYTRLDNSIGGSQELPMQLQVTWVNYVGACIIHSTTVLDKNRNLIWKQPVIAMLDFNLEITFNFTNLIFNGYRAEDLFI